MPGTSRDPVPTTDGVTALCADAGAPLDPLRARGAREMKTVACPEFRKIFSIAGLTRYGGLCV